MYARMDDDVDDGGDDTWWYAIHSVHPRKSHPPKQKLSLSIALSEHSSLPLFPSLFKPSTSRVSFYFIKPLPSKALNLIDKTLS